MKKIIKQWLPTIMIAVILSLTLRTFVVEAMIVPSGSMTPTVQIHDRVVVEKLKAITTYDYGDIVVFHPPIPGGSDTRYVKRLIGLPGDMIEIKEGSLYRNNEKVNESYIHQEMNYTFGPVTVPAGDYFFLGDNRNNSYDSHLWDTPFVQEDRLIGKVLFEIPVHYLYNN